MKVSIITINKDNLSGLNRTIHSILNQTFKSIQFIVIDGNSTDRSINLLKKFSKLIDYWISEPDTGIYQAMNKGIQKASGEYCLFLNSGDWFIDDYVLQKCFDIGFKEDIVYGHQVKEADGGYIEDPCLDVPYISFLTLKRSHIPHQVTFVKRSLFDKIGYYNENNKIVSDWEFIMKALFIYRCSIRRIPIYMTVYDTNGLSSIQKYKDLQFIERRRFLEAQFPLFIKDYDYYEAFMQKWYIRFSLLVRDKMNALLHGGRKKRRGTIAYQNEYKKEI